MKWTDWAGASLTLGRYLLTPVFANASVFVSWEYNRLHP